MFREPQDKSYEVLLAENRFISDIQISIERALDELDMSQADLARALGITEARVSQILADNGKNLQARTIARIAHVLGMEVNLKFIETTVAATRNDTKSDRAKANFKSWIRLVQNPKEDTWIMPCNDDQEVSEFKELQRA